MGQARDLAPGDNVSLVPRCLGEEPLYGKYVRRKYKCSFQQTSRPPAAWPLSPLVRYELRSMSPLLGVLRLTLKQADAIAEGWDRRLCLPKRTSALGGQKGLAREAEHRARQMLLAHPLSLDG